jgi:signal transduction histidine kinase
MTLAELQQSIAGTTQEFFLLTLDGRFVWANELGVRSLGRSPVGARVRDVVQGPDRFAERQAALRGGDLRPFETTHLDAQGQPIEKEGRAFFVAIDGVEHFAVFMRDVRPHKALEAELQNITQLYTLLAQINVALRDAKDDQSLFVRLCEVATQPGCFRMAWVGVIEGDHIRPVAHAGAAHHYLEGLEIGLDAQGPSGVSARTGRVDVCPDLAASTRMLPWRDRALARAYLASAGVPLHCGQRVVGTLGLYAGEPNFFNARERLLLQHIADDASYALTTIGTRRERDELRAQLQRSQQLAAVGRLAASVGHDFNNLLTVILGSAETALHTLPDDSPARVELNEIHEVAIRSARLTRQLLKRARGDEPMADRIELVAAVRDAVPMLERLAGSEVKLRFTTTIDSARVPFSATQLDQVLTNLVANAREAMRGTGHLTLSVGRADVSAEQATRHGVKPGAFAALAVADDGPGIPLEVQSRIFEPFFTTKAAQGGTGLGLATVMGLCTQAGGFVVVDSKVGSGATFTVHLPLLASA